MLLIFLVQLAWAQQDPPVTTCLTSECETLSKRYLSHMKHEVDPCEDFHEYACGNYPAQHPIPEHEGRMTTLLEMQTNIDNQLRELLENAKFENMSRSLFWARTFFDSCMNEASRERFGKDPLLHLIRRLGGWELLDGSIFNETTFQWEELLGNILHHGVFYVIYPYVWPSINNSDKHILMFESFVSFLTNRGEYFKKHDNSTLLQLHRLYIVKMLEKLGAKRGAEFEKRVDGLIAFEKILVNISAIQPNQTMLTYGEIKSRYNNINWDSILNEEIKKSLGGVDDSTMMHLDVPAYFVQLNELITLTPKREIYDYLHWRLVADYIPYLPENYQEPLKEFNSKSYGASKIAPLKEQCAKETRARFGLTLASEFFHKMFNSVNKSEVEDMISNIKNAMKSELETMDWLDEETRKEALNKLNLMRSKLVYPEYIHDREYVGRPYGNIHLTADHYFDNVIRLRQMEQRYSFQKLNRKVGEDWLSNVLGVDAGYNAARNEMEIPGSILRAPMFIPNAPLFINYGAIGAVLAHEVTHGFDTRGSNYDELGNYRNWWDEKTWEKFQNKSQCFVEQYGTEVEPITNENQNSGNTLQENVADNGGVRIAYQAYQKELNEKKDIRVLPNFQKFSSDKMFFIAFANNFCVSSKKPSISDYLKTDAHAFERFRVNVPLRNFPAFSKAFNCQKGKMMYKPENTCRVW